MENNTFRFEYKTDNDIKNDIKERIKGLKEEQKSTFVFNGEHFYLLGRGHSFLNGFYNEYMTKSGIIGCEYYMNRWEIGDNDYKYINCDFIEIPKIEYKPTKTDFNDLSLPIIKNVKTIGDDLIPVKPKNK